MTNTPPVFRAVPSSIFIYFKAILVHGARSCDENCVTVIHPSETPADERIARGRRPT